MRNLCETKNEKKQYVYHEVTQVIVYKNKIQEHEMHGRMHPNYLGLATK